MSDMLTRLKKRRKTEVSIDGDKFYVRATTNGETAAISQFTDMMLANGFALGCTLVNDNGDPVCPRNEGESNADFAKRAAELFADVPVDTVSALMDAVMAASKVPSMEKTVKN